jgi:PAS domain S-box-containing protein
LSDRTRSAELAALTSIAAQVNCTQDLDEILAGALQTTLEVIGERSGQVFLLDEESDNLILFTHQGLSDAFVAEEAVVGSDECICGQALQSRQISIVPEMATHPARNRSACVREGFHSCIRLPLLARGEMLGLLCIQSRNQRLFAPEDEDLLTAIGNQIGIAIANAQLIEDAERRRATLDSVMNSLVDGLVLVDTRSRIAYLNPHTEEILGLPAGALVGQALDTSGQALAEHVAQPEQVLAQLRYAVENPQDTPTVEFTLTEPEARSLQARFFPIQDAGGGSLGLGLLLRDITREREVDDMKSQLLSTVSHELRTPLASIKGFTTTLLRDDVEWDPETRREFLSIIDEESDRLTELIGNLLDMSRIEAGTLRVEPEPIELVPIIRETGPATIRSRFACRQPCRRLWPIRGAPARSCATWWKTRSSIHHREDRSRYRPGPNRAACKPACRIKALASSRSNWTASLIVFTRWIVPRHARLAAVAWDCPSAKPL